MTRLRRGTVWTGIGLAALFAVVAACDEEPMGTNGGGGGTNISDPAAFQAFMEQTFAAGALGVIDGFNRLFVAASGGPADGVVITQTGPSDFTTEVSIDLDGDGTRESTLFGASSGDITTGAALSVTGFDNPNSPTANAMTSSVATQTGPNDVLFTNLGGDISADPPGSGNAATVFITDGQVALDLVSGNLDGFVDCVVEGEDASGATQTLSVATTFQPDGQGGWEAEFSGQGFTFTVP